MVYNFNEKNINIPDDEINVSMKNLQLTKDEAIQMWLDDNGYSTNEVVEELTEKAKKNKTVVHGAKANKPRKEVKRERKPDEEKENIIRFLAEALKNCGDSIEITNKSKIIEFSVGENHYKLDLIKKRTPKNA